MSRECLQMADFVEEVGVGSDASSTIVKVEASRRPLRRFRFGHRDELGEFPEVLGGCCEMELIAGAVRTA
jgi:hypothetical protein